MELICINDIYTQDQLDIFLKYEIKYPKEGEIVELVGIDKTRMGVGLFVSPYHNQYIKSIAYGVETSREVSFSSKRFTTLLGEPITTEMLQEIKKNMQKPKEYAKINENPSNPNDYYN